MKQDGSRLAFFHRGDRWYKVVKATQDGAEASLLSFQRLHGDAQGNRLRTEALFDLWPMLEE